MQTFLAAESDTTCKRNAFIFLASCATSKAVEWVLSVYDQILGFEDLMQLAIIDMIRKDCKGDTPNRVLPFSFYSSRYYVDHILQPKYLRCIFELLNAASSSVKYEAATILTTLAQNPAAVKGIVPSDFS
jgi:coatomer subunit beta